MIPGTTKPNREGIGEELWLLFELKRERYAIPLAGVAGVGEPAAIRVVHGTPPALLGLTQWRGALLTVLDLARLLGHAQEAGRPCLLHLSPPFGGTALHLPTSLRVGWAPAPEPTDSGTPHEQRATIECEGAVYRLIDPARLLASIRLSTDG